MTRDDPWNTQPPVDGYPRYGGHPPQFQQAPPPFQQAPPPFQQAPPPPPNYLPPAGFGPPDPPRRRGPILLVSALVLVVALAAGGAFWYLTSKDDSNSTVAADSLLRYTFPTAPQAAWSVTPGDVGGRPGDAFYTPEGAMGMGNSPGYFDAGGTLVTMMGGVSPDVEFTLIGLDSSSGEPRWSREAATTTCLMTVVDNAMPCIVRSDGTANTVEFVDVDSGATRNSFAPDFVVSDAATDGSTIFLAGYTDSAQFYTSGTVDDPTGNWSSGPLEPDLCPGGADGALFRYAQGNLFHTSGISSWVVDAATGTLASSGAFRSSLPMGDGYAQQSCMEFQGSRRSASPTVTVVDGSGDTLFEKDGSFRTPSPTVTARTRVPLFIGDSAYEPDTGDLMWESSALSPEGDWASLSVVGDVVLTVADGSMTAVDLDDGTTRWTVPIGDGLQFGPTDGERILVADDSGVDAYDLVDGARAWSIPASTSRIDTAGDLFAVTDGTSITAYAPTGGPATIPGSDPSTSGSDSAASGSGGGELVTKCGSRPRLEPVSFRTDAGGLVVEMRVRATCPGGDILSTDALRVTISDNGVPVASSTFDFSDEPLVLPSGRTGGADYAAAQLRYPLGSFWRLPNSLGDGKGGVGDTVVDCEDEGSSTGPTSAPVPSGTSSPPAFDSKASAVSRVDTESASRDALREQADADAPFVRSDLADRWVPLLSSKQPGLVADGITWNNAEILREHLDLRLRFPEVRLMWSGDWSTFTERDWWVTAAGVTFPTPEGANGWCDSKGFDADHCFAKLISTTHSVDGSTLYRK
ncbi:PQQ-binding-like beta-propeller repeat protein [Prescottella defluvii]|uniref:outer membrane protein assembly factor BamB family protein n=1 Tax=Prescottella defluvii TaxID=1323361 RepID=UPI0004F31307|nr:PQQ-binding-like beta-propeller repeat protein [Prescottella defluvii]